MTAQFIQTKFAGYDEAAIEKFYSKTFKASKKLGKSDTEAHEQAQWFVEYYKHQFRKYTK